MMQYFNFSRLVNKYKNEITVVSFSEGGYDDKGDWVKGEKTETILEGAVISFKESKIFRSEGTLTTRDKRLFTLKPIEKALLGSKVVHNNVIYNLEECTENAQFTGVYAYMLKYVSAFSEKALRGELNG